MSENLNSTKLSPYLFWENIQTSNNAININGW